MGDVKELSLGMQPN